MKIETTNKQKPLGSLATIRLRDGRLTVHDERGRGVASLAGPLATVELAVVDGELEVLSALSTDEAGVSSLWPFDDYTPPRTGEVPSLEQEIADIASLLEGALQ